MAAGSSQPKNLSYSPNFHPGFRPGGNISQVPAHPVTCASHELPLAPSAQYALAPQLVAPIGAVLRLDPAALAGHVAERGVASRPRPRDRACRRPPIAPRHRRTLPVFASAGRRVAGLRGLAGARGTTALRRSRPARSARRTPCTSAESSSGVAAGTRRATGSQACRLSRARPASRRAPLARGAARGT